jgi:hypothetical protein
LVISFIGNDTLALINPIAVHKFIALVHERAAAAIAGMGARPVALQLCSAAPDDTRFFHSAYNIGDIQNMAADAIVDSKSGKNVFIEPRLVRPGRPSERRGDLISTLAVFASVADGDRDMNKPFTAPVPASAVVQTSETNEHSWYFLKRAVGYDDAQELGRLMRQSAGGDRCSGNCVQPFRVAGTANYPNSRKVARGRIPVATKIKCVTNRVYSIDELRAHFSTQIPHHDHEQRRHNHGENHSERHHCHGAMAVHSRAYSRGMAKAILAAEPGVDRSARFMAAAMHAVNGGLTADQFQELALRYPDGCAGKYHDRLRLEIDRCYAKARRKV